MGGAVLNSAALTVGRIHGAAWIGQPLALSVPVQTDTAGASLCAEADVYYADALQDPARIRVQQTPGSQGDTQVLQITSAINIDEPMVTVYLRVGCEQKVSRRYVLLADYPSVPASGDARGAIAETVATSTAVDTPDPLQASPLDAIAPSSTTSTANTATTRTVAPKPSSVKTPPVRKAARTAPAPHKAAPKPAVAAPKPETRTPTAPAAAASAAPAGPLRSRLKLDPLENLSERIKTLETTTTAIPLEDMVRDAQRIQQLQGDVKKLLDQAAKNEATLAQMRERLEKAEAERVSSMLVYALAALLLVCLAVIAVLWNRRASGPSGRPDWSASQNDDDDDGPAPKLRPSPPPPAATTAVEPPAVAPVAVPPRKESALGMDLVEMEADDASYNEFVHTKPFASAVAAASTAAPAPLLDAAPPAHDFNAEKQFDLRQQAEFFDRLGKTDEAIELLEKRIRANSKDCPLIYLELLRIANTHSLKTDFRQFRDECMQTFNVAVPEFALFRNEGRGLDAFPDLLAHIEKLWHTPKVLDVLESCILRDPWEKNAKPFDLAAFKELIELHGLASRATPPAPSSTGPAATGTSDTPDAMSIDLEL